MNFFLLGRYRNLLGEANHMTDSIRDSEHERLFGSDNVFSLVGELPNGEQEELPVSGSFEQIQKYLDNNRDKLFETFVGIHIKRT